MEAVPGSDCRLTERQVKETLAFYEAHRQEIEAGITAEQALEETYA